MIGKKGVVWQAAVLAGGCLVQSGAAQAESYILPSSAFRAGANSAEYRTDVRLLNQGTSAVTVTASFYDQVTSATFPANPFSIEARSQAAFDNILQSLFGKTLSQGAYGPIRFDASGPIIVSAGVNNVNACGSGAVSGQWLPGIAASQALKAGTIGNLAVSASTGSGYHTNLVFMNPGGTPATVTVKVRRGGGTLLSTGTIGPLAANGFSQVALDGGVFPGVAGTTDTNLWLEFTSDQPVLAYATMINNASGDPFAVVATGDTPPAAGQQEITVTLPGGVPLVLVQIKGGTPFMMGAPSGERESNSSEKPQHQVTIAQDYYLGRYEVTQAQWESVMGWNPSRFFGVGADYPVYDVSWLDVAGPGGFLERLNRAQGTTKFRLPTEAEWEYAARGGTTTEFSFSVPVGWDTQCGVFPAAEAHMWWCGNAASTAHPVGERLANPWGLFDMNGNVWEWVQDHWHDDYTGNPPADGSAWLAPGDWARVLRGGSWHSSAGFCRSAQRYSYYPDSWGHGILGFRLARSQ